AWAIGIGATTFGYNSFAGADRATSLGANAWVLDTATNSVALGHGSLADRPDTISVGAAVDWSPSLDGDGDGIPDGGMIAAFDRQITNVAAGTHDTDAVNLGQLNEAVGQFDAAVANAVQYDDADRGTITLAGEDGTAIANVAAGEVSADSGDAVNGSQLFETNERVAVAEGRIDDLDGRIGDIAGVAANAVQYDDADHGTITLAGEDGTVIANVAAGAISAGSGEAVNGSQLHAALDGVAQYLGGGMEVTAFGTLSAPAFMVQGSTYFSVGDALGALDAQISALGQRVDGAAGGTAASDRVAVGGDAPASIGEGTNAVAIGSGATANGENGVAIGGGAHAHGPDDVAIGGGARVGADGSVAVGANASIAAGATNAVAMGEGASVTAASGTAIGQGASVIAEGAVALGQGSVADRAHTVSVGSAGGERQITNVAAGTEATDAVNVAQLDASATRTLAQANEYTDQKFAAWNDSFTTLRNDVEQRLGHIEQRMDRQGAMGAAMLNMATNAAGAHTERGRVAVGAGFQGG